jgi:hypothetical protein
LTNSSSAWSSAVAESPEFDDRSWWHTQAGSSGAVRDDSTESLLSGRSLAFIPREEGDHVYLVPATAAKWPPTGSNGSWIESSWQSEAVERAHPPWFDESVSTLRRLLQLPQNWDSYGAARIERPVAERTIDVFLSVIGRSDLRDVLPAPRVVPCPDGSIQLEWSMSDRELEIVIHSHPSRSIEYLAVGPSGYEEGEVDQVRVVGTLHWLVGTNDTP